MATHITLPLLAGVATHLCLFNRYELHRHIKDIYTCSLVTLIACLWLTLRYLGPWHGILGTIQLAVLTLAGIFTSTLIYRLFFNPLNRFPGPYSARLTDFWMAFHAKKSLNQYKILDGLHKKYGPYVRTGANQLSITDPNLIEPAYSGAQKSGITKSGFYDFDWPARSLLSERTHHGHQQRRRMWSPAFSDKALRQYETKVSEFNDKFMRRIEQSRSHQSIDVSNLFGLYSFDVMGSLVFGEQYGMLESGRKVKALELLTEGLAALGLSLPIWFFLFVKSLPLDSGTRGFVGFVNEQIEVAVKKRKSSIAKLRRLSVASLAAIRRPSVIAGASLRKLSICIPGAAFAGVQAERNNQKKSFDGWSDSQVAQAVQRRRTVVAQKAPPSSEDQRSILYWVLKTYGDRPNLEKDTFLQSDAKLLIIAGSDTTAATFTYLFYHLALSRTDVEKIREEIGDCENLSDKSLRRCQHLNGAINEALRLHPPGPSGVHRTTPKEGLRVGQVYLPGSINFNMPVYTINKDENLYPEANTFMPERWYGKPEYVKNRKAFIPFLAGANSCLGKNLALAELRTLTARILTEYNVKFAPGEDGTRLLHKSKDHFTVSLAPLDLVFVPLSERKRSSLGSPVSPRSDFSAWRGLRRDSCISRDVIPEEDPFQNWTW